MDNREQLRAWLDEQRGAGTDEPLSGTLALASLIYELQIRVKEVERINRTLQSRLDTLEKLVKKSKTAD